METIKGLVQPSVVKFDKHLSYAIFSRCHKYSPQLKPFLLALEWSCHGLIWLAVNIILIVYNQQSSMLPKLLIGLIMDVFYVAVIKALARRRRPDYAYQRDQYIVAGVDKHSFPSGHCTRSVYVACFIAHYFGHTSPILCFFTNVWATSVSMSRIVLGRHHVLDCVAGILIGFLEFWLQFHTFLPINFFGMLLIRGLFGYKAFNDTNDLEDTDPTD